MKPTTTARWHRRKNRAFSRRPGKIFHAY